MRFLISTEGEDEDASVAPTMEAAETVAEPTTPASEPISSNGSNGSHRLGGLKSSSGRFYSPLVKNIAKEENIGIAELESAAAPGAAGRPRPLGAAARLGRAACHADR